MTRVWRVTMATQQTTARVSHASVAGTLNIPAITSPGGVNATLGVSPE